MKALVIEDTVTSATLVCHQLRKMGLEPTHAKDGTLGVEAFKANRPDLVLLDIIMPGLNGFEVAKRIRQLERDGEWTTIIFLTARTSDEDLQRGIEVGGDDYLVKPVSEVVLGAKVRAMQRIAQMRYSLLVLTRKLDDANNELRRLSSVDGLTGIANRRELDETLLREWRRGIRSGRPLSLLVADVDYFKQFNDGYGHQIGDECLKAVARSMQGELKRSSDLLARFGGEEFVVVLPETDIQGAAAVSESVRKAVEAMAITHRHAPVPGVVTISVGVASLVPEREKGPEALIEAADQALYEAKRSGRNRVVVRMPGRGATPAEIPPRSGSSIP